MNRLSQRKINLKRKRSSTAVFFNSILEGESIVKAIKTTFSRKEINELRNSFTDNESYEKDKESFLNINKLSPPETR